MDKVEKRVALGKLLRGLRELKSLNKGKTFTQTDVAKHLGLDKHNTVQAIESGKMAPPINRFRDFASLYGEHDMLTLVLAEYATPEAWELVKDIIDTLQKLGVIEWKNTNTKDLQGLCDAVRGSYYDVLEKKGISV